MADGATGETRPRTHTEKGLEYHLDRKSKYRRGCENKLVSLSEDIEELLTTSTDVNEVKELYKKWLKVYDELLFTHESLQGLLKLSTGSGESDDKEFQDRNSRFHKVKDSVEQWFAKHSMQPTPKKIPSDVKSRLSSASKTSSQISLEKLKESQRKAELLAKASALDEQRKLEAAKLELKMKEEELKIKTELQISDARSKLLEELEKSELRDQELENSLINENIDRIVTFDLDRENEFTCDNSTPRIPHRSVQRLVRPELSTPIYEPSSEIQTVARELNKPKADLQKFDGNPMNYTRFLRQFNARICSNTESYEERLNYLLQFTVGEAQRIVSGYSYLDAERGYKAALEELKDRYGDPDIIAQAYVKKALDWPPVKPDSAKTLDQFAIFLRECQYAVENIDTGRVLEYSENLKLLVKKLPFYLHDKWRSCVYELKEKKQAVKFHHLADFVRKEAKKATDPIYGREIMSSSANKRFQDQKKSEAHKNFAVKTNTRSFYDNSATQMKPVFKHCTFCNGAHSLDMCLSITILPLKDRYAFLKTNGLCFACLRYGHVKTNCRQRMTCAHCKKYHPSILHVDPRQNEGTNGASTSREHTDGENPLFAMSSTVHMGAGKQALPIVPVRVKSKFSDKYLETYAFLDSGSNATFCLEDIARLLKLEGRKMNLNLTTMGQQHTQTSHVISGLEISDINGVNVLELPPVYTQPTLPASRTDVISPEDIENYPYLSDIELPRIDSDVGILIGVNVPRAMEPWDVIPSVDNGPFAVKTLLGWVINGPLEIHATSNDTYVSVNRVDAKLMNNLEEQIRNQFNHDFNERTIDDKCEPSKEDRRFIECVSNSIHFEDGHYVISLPFKSENVCLPNNRKQVEQRLSSLQKRFSRDENFHKEYCVFMNKILEEGYAVKVPDEKVIQDDGQVWYLPHHGVYHPKKRKLRVVFDCAARYQGTSLNEQLLQGPNLTNTLIGTLLRFRQDEIVIMGDIDSMFYQVKVPQEDASFLRFLWWEDGNPRKRIIEYQMVVHLFGATSSPSCANYALRKTAQDYKGLYNTEVINTVLKNFYVDDCLKSVKTVTEASSLLCDLQDLLMRGGFHITKWISNSREVMTYIPVSRRAKEVKDLDLENDTLPIDRALGVQWCVENDVFCFKMDIKDQPLTRRGILSMVSSVFDPLGFLAPFTLKAKCLLQELCKLQLGWDEKIPGHLAQQWNEWLQDLERLSDFKVSRCYKPVGFGEIKSAQLHHFADASERGYGTVSYLRQENFDGAVHCSFVIGKSRVAPLKQTTIPRLELTAATVAVRTDKMLKSELDVPIDETVFWTDSMAVIRYIRNTSSRFHTFVANRLAVIHEGSLPDEWRYINTKQNPADLASRGMSANDILQGKHWITAPEVLLAKNDSWAEKPMELSDEIPVDDPEVKKITVRAVIHTRESCDNHVDSVERLLNYHSSWYKLKKSVAWILKVKKKLFLRTQRKTQLENQAAETCLSAEDLQEAEVAILKFIQRKSFASEIEELKKGHPVKLSSNVRKLDPILDDGLIRVGGRLHRASMPLETKHPIILPKDHHVSNLILRQIHCELKHSGRNHMLSILRQKYWLIHAPSSIRKLISKCIVCRRQKARVGEQKMAQLPEDRLIPDEPPFTRVGVDYFGPFEVKLKRSHVKRYGVIFTCLASRAVHLEVASSLTTDSYINALRRFIARRGQVKKIRSDNGTNFVGANRELRNSINDWNVSQIHEAMLQKNIDWHFNPPAGSHHGGVWERIIRTIRKVMNSVLREQILDDEGLNTLMCEIEAILNDRPITKNSDHHNDLEALTPNHLLLMRQQPNLPPGVFTKSDNYCRRRWRQVQYMANLFWNRWVKEYLPLLQERQKWHEVKRNLKIGDVVLVVDSNSPRNSWPMGVVLETVPDRFGLVRQVKVKTATNTLMRPIDKLCLILEMDEPSV